MASRRDPFGRKATEALPQVCGGPASGVGTFRGARSPLLVAL